MSFEEVIKIFKETKRKNLHIVFIHRRGYENWGYYLEIGFCTMDNHTENGDIFLWIECQEKEIPYFVEKYKLNRNHGKRNKTNLL